MIALYLLSCTAQNLLNIALLFTQDLGLSRVLTGQVLHPSIPGWLCIQQSLLGHAFPEGPQPKLCILRLGGTAHLRCLLLSFAPCTPVPQYVVPWHANAAICSSTEISQGVMCPALCAFHCPGVEAGGVCSCVAFFFFFLNLDHVSEVVESI